METVGSSVGSSVGSPLFRNMKKVGSSVGSVVGCPWEFCHANKATHYFDIWKQWAAQWAATTSTHQKMGSSVGSGVGCPCAAHGNFAMQIRLPTTAITRYSGQLSGQLSG